MVKSPFLAARESLVLFFENSRKRFLALESSTTVMKGGSRNSRVTHKIDEQQTVYTLFVRLHGMLFTKIGLEYFEEIEQALLQRVHIDSDDKLPMECQWCDLYFKMAVINLSSFYDYGSTETSSFKHAIKSHDDTEEHQTVAADIAFSQACRLTFKLMHELMLKYNDLDANFQTRSASEGWILYSEIVLLWMVTSGVFKRPVEEHRESVWQVMISRSILAEFWPELARFLTLIAGEVASAKGKIVGLLNVGNTDDEYLLRYPVLPEDWKLRGIVWLERIYSSKLFEEDTELFVKCVKDQNDQLLRESVEMSYSSWLLEDVVLHRRIRILELGIIVSHVGFNTKSVLTLHESIMN
jgi:hypothetical protein